MLRPRILDIITERRSGVTMSKSRASEPSSKLSGRLSQGPESRSSRNDEVFSSHPGMDASENPESHRQVLRLTTVPVAFGTFVSVGDARPERRVRKRP